MTAPNLELVGRLALALAVGLLPGFEREWANKDLGLRTFAVVAMAGMLGAVAGPAVAAVVVAGVLALVVLANLRELRQQQHVEITTSSALLLTCVLGILVGRGEVTLPVAASIVTTLLLSWKRALQKFVGNVKPEEMQDALWLGMIACVIYPLLPNRALDPWGLFNPHQVWLAIIVVGAVGFANYLFLRAFSSRGLLYSAVLGGAVSSAATMVELGGTLREAGDAASLALSVPAIMLADMAMVGRNAALLAIFAPGALASAWLPLAAMGGVAALLATVHRDPRPVPAIALSSPVSFRRVFEFGAIFLAVTAAAALGVREFGRYGLYVVSLLGGILNSAGTTVAAAEMTHGSSLAASAAGAATVIATLASAAANTVLMNRQVRHPACTRRAYLYTAVLIVAGLALVAVARG